MSTDQPTLSESVPSPHQQALEGEGARYGAASNERSSVDRDGPENICENCGHRIRAEIARKLGDNNGNVPVCENCRHDVLTEEGKKRDLYRGIGKLIAAVRADDDVKCISMGEVSNE